jgi:transcription termination/antitermination protein NusG
VTEPFVSEFKDETVDLESTSSSEVSDAAPEVAAVADETTGDAGHDALVDTPATEVESSESAEAQPESAELADAVPESAELADAVPEPAEQADAEPEPAELSDPQAEPTAPAEPDLADAGLEAGEAQSEPIDAVAEPQDDEAGDPLEEFRAALRSKPGDWYVVHTYSGMEKRVKANLENRITSLNMEDFIYEVHVPQEDVWEVKNGQRKQVSRTVLPGYVLVRMDLTDESWSAVRHTPSVTGFVGHSHQPVPLSLGEVEAMLAPAVTEEKTAPAEKAQQRVEFTDFAVNDSVLIVDGAFATLHATITEINVDAQRVKALVEIFGRETPVELSFSQIQKV